MNIYFSCSITGGRRDQEIYQAIVEALLMDGHEVPTAELSAPDVLVAEAMTSPEAVYERDIRWLYECDGVVAEVSTPSHGVGYEIAFALLLGKPVFCCYQTGRQVSKMITGNTSSGLQVIAYQGKDDLLPSMREFLDQIRRGCFAIPD